jgi:hypothetical protein
VLVDTLRLFASGSAALLLSLAGCSLVIDTDPPDPQLGADAGRDAAIGAIDLGTGDLGSVDLGSVDLGSVDSSHVDLGAADLGVDDGGALDATLPLPDGGTPDAGCLLDRECDDGAQCTDDRCQFGMCSNLPIPLFCDDGASCTVDLCVPATMCAGPMASRLGCEHRPVDAACAAYAVTIVATYPSLACAPVTCIGGTAGNETGCGFGDSRCAFGETCGASGLCAITTGERACDRAGDCDDGNPCNGDEVCGARGTANVCAPATTSPCQPTPTGPTFPGTCALSPLASGGFDAICAALADACTARP